MVALKHHRGNLPDTEVRFGFTAHVFVCSKNDGIPVLGVLDGLQQNICRILDDEWEVDNRVLVSLGHVSHYENTKSAQAKQN
jgi:hypothetical protein